MTIPRPIPPPLAFRLIPLLIEPTLIGLLLAGRAFPAALVCIGLLPVFSVVQLRTLRRLDEFRGRVDALESELADAYTDPVTGLYARSVAEQYLADRTGSVLTVAVVDVDDLHGINATYGHEGGDVYLATIAQRLKTVAGGQLAARLGGDEFVLVTDEGPHALARAISQICEPPARVGSARVPIRVSVGITHTSGGDSSTALGQADRAMFTAKRRGGGVQIYDPGRDGHASPSEARPASRRRDSPPARHCVAE
ncbi:GGDEF domain-containing protein [Cryptosporangium phraense]|uniref:GGDEF domain-containing protein n=1 Tax=Cryptosporangium phraense TaxID=2593070 RepID=A0A545AFS3_9ACTN|nr:GGDEF domain-containing protein [Cryptosporangium phraense]TQS39485.1 GGDEF domain-containing protein [Cryptosporangium phraense]